LTIQLSPTKNPGQTAAYAEIIEKLKKQILPDEFIYIRIIKSTLEFIRCEAEIENKSALKNLLTKLDGSTIKMNSYTDVLKVRAAESKIVYPIRHDWESFFKDATGGGLDSTLEPKAGERPDTVHLNDLPCKWFSDRKTYNSSADASLKPSETILKDVFSLFGEVRALDVPMISNSFGTAAALLNSSSNTVIFEAFIQYKDYISFVKAMDTFRGMKLLYIDNETNEASTANIRVSYFGCC
jgi:arginine/serine-rich splicing factor 17